MLENRAPDELIITSSPERLLPVTRRDSLRATVRSVFLYGFYVPLGMDLCRVNKQPSCSIMTS